MGVKAVTHRAYVKELAMHQLHLRLTLQKSVFKPSCTPVGTEPLRLTGILYDPKHLDGFLFK